MPDAARAASRLGRVRNILEVDATPSPAAFFVRALSRAGSRWSFSRLGNYYRTELELKGVAGGTWIAKPFEFLRADLVGRRQVFEHAFASLHSTRLLYSQADDALLDLYEAFDPEIVIAGEESSVAEGWTRRRTMIDGEAVEVAFAGRSARDAFDEEHARYTATLQAQGRAREVLIEARDLLVWDGFHGIESSNHHDWIWTGASREARFVVPSLARGRLRVTLFLFSAHVALAPHAFSLSFDGVEVPTRVMPEFSKIEADFDFPASPTQQMFVALRHAELRPTPDGDRELGVAVHRVKVECL